MPPIILRVPHFQQQSRGDCLAACAQMVLVYMGRSISYRRLLKLLRVRPDIGAPASNIRKLEKVGVHVRYQTGSLEVLWNHLLQDQPCIVFVNTEDLPYWHENTAHALVVVGLDDQSVYLNDPAFPDAPFQISRDEFGLARLEWDEYYAVLM